MTISHPDHRPYLRFTGRQRIDKAIHTLTGLLRGVALDDELNAAELAELVNWCNEFRPLVDRAPFRELIPKIDEIMEDGIADPDEIEDLLWLCKNLSPDGDYYDEITHQIQTLQGVLHGIMADGHASLAELRALQDWVDDHAHLKGTYPYDELDSLLISVLADGVIDENEQILIQSFFEEFINYSSKKQSENRRSKRVGELREKTLPSICSACPEILFPEKSFTLTGTSKRAKRSEIVAKIVESGGNYNGNLSKKTDFLVVGGGGNPCWAFSTYGRKVEKAANYRKEGLPIIIVHESDFWDAIEDLE